MTNVNAATLQEAAVRARQAAEELKANREYRAADVCEAQAGVLNAAAERREQVEQKMRRDTTVTEWRTLAEGWAHADEQEMAAQCLIAAEQREQLDMSRAQVASSDHAASEMFKRKNEQIATLTDEVDMVRRAYETVQDNEFAARSPSTHAQNLAQQVRTLTAERDEAHRIACVLVGEVADLTAANKSLDAHCMVLQHDIRTALAELDEARHERELMRVKLARATYQAETK